MGNLVAIVGRPNVGKSTLFNRLTETRTAIVSETAGTTRDRQYGHVLWGGREFSLVDTGGWVVNSEDIFEDEINKQVEIAIEEADVILFLVDIMNGVTDLDDQVARILRKSGKEVIVVANKADNYDQHVYAAEFYSLGLGDPFIISSANGSGTGDLLDEVISRFKKDDTDDIEDLPKFAIVGRPNAGKSSLLNAFMGEERHIVTDIAGTTRDSIYTKYDKFGFNFYLVDTAGIRKKNKVSEDIEGIPLCVDIVIHRKDADLSVDALPPLASARVVGSARIDAHDHITVLVKITVPKIHIPPVGDGG